MLDSICHVECQPRMNTLLLPILFMGPIDAMAPTAPKPHIDRIGAVKVGGGKLIPIFFIAQS